MNVLGEFHKYDRKKNIINQYDRIKKHKSKKKRKKLYKELKNIVTLHTKLTYK